MTQQEIDKHISEFLIYACAYYLYGKSLISDQYYDNIAHILLDNFESVKESNHIHKHMITKKVLETQSLYNVKEWPIIIKDCANIWIKEGVNE